MEIKNSDMEIKKSKSYQNANITGLSKHTNLIGNSVIGMFALISLFFLSETGFAFYTGYSLLAEIVLLILLFWSLFYYNTDLRDIIYFIGSSLFFLLTLVFTHGGTGSVLIMGISMLWIILIKNCRFSIKSVNIFIIIFLLIFVAVILRCKAYFERWVVTESLIFNPNTLAFLLVLSSSMNICFWQYKKTNKYLLIKGLFIVLTYWGVLNCKSRASLLMFSLFLVFKYIVPLRYKKSYRFTLMVFCLIVFSGVTFPLLYVWLYQNGHNFHMPIIGKLMQGKTFYSGRELIWLSLFTKLNQNWMNWFIGIGSHAAIPGITGNLNLHNVYMQVLMNFGLSGICIYFYFFFREIKNIYSKKRILPVQIDFIYLCLSYFALNIFEVTALWNPFIVFTAMLWALPHCFNREAII